LVVNSGIANGQCPSCEGFYGTEIRVLLIDLLDDPKEGEAHTCAGDSHRYFRMVSSEIKATIGSGHSALVHCMASLSRSVVLILAYLMEYHSLTALDATKFLKSVWDPTWPNDQFVKDLIKLEEELQNEKK
jgi:protein-tyrosine phosphatase